MITEAEQGLWVVSFDVPGIPAGQGAHRVSPTGHIYETTKNHRPWRDAVTWHARQAWGELSTIDGPVQVDAIFGFPRPRSHYRTGKHAHELKPTAPTYHTGTPDLDHLQRTVGDALEQAGVLRNDKLIAHWEPWKVYVDHPGVIIRIHIL